ncbi:MAG: hypothetical protein ACXABF_16440 [Candidatus Thorarchaeota archaeon]|jgi:hypothetical protein
MREQIIEAALGGFIGLPIDYWQRLRERLIPAIVNTSSDEETLERVKYHATQVREIYREDIARRGQEMPDEYTLALRRRITP